MKNVAFYSANAASSGLLNNMLSGYFQITGFFESPDALEAYSQTSDVNLLVIEMTPAISFETLRRIAANTPGSRLVVWTDIVSAELVSDCISLGIRGVLSKSASAEAHVRCLAEVSNGKLWIDQALGASLLNMAEPVVRTLHFPQGRRHTVQSPPWRSARNNGAMTASAAGSGSLAP